MVLAQRARWAGAYAAAWTPLVLVYAVLIGTANRLPVGRAVWEAMSTVCIAAMLGLGVVAFTLAVERQAMSLTARLWRHAGGAVVYSLLWNTAVLLDIRGNASWAEVFDVVQSWFGWQLFFGVVIYGTVAGVLTGIMATTRGRAQDAALQRADALRARAELAALRGRLDPHFLFNTLHTVGALVRRDPAAAEAGLERLADLLRYVLDHTGGARDEVPLDDELAFVDDYLALEAIRLGDRLRIVRRVDDDVRDARIPSLALQPLVENAIRHGIAPKPAGGTLTLLASRTGDTLEIVVADDGAGATPDTGPSGYGLGLDSLRKRLDATYGSRASLGIVTKPGAGFSVTVRIPT
jgi:hypothetical protein